MAKRTTQDSQQQSKNNNSDGSSTTRQIFGSESSTESFRRDTSEQIGDTEIAARAYEIYEREGRVEGRDLDHWYRAELELRSERQRGKSPNEVPRSARIRGAQSPAV